MNWKDLKELNATVEQDDRTPEGYRMVVLKAYSNGEKLVFPEQPEWSLPDDEEDLSHNCDVEGCGFSHVMRHVPIRRDWEAEEQLERLAWALAEATTKYLSPSAAAEVMASVNGYDGKPDITESSGYRRACVLLNVTQRGYEPV